MSAPASTAERMMPSAVPCPAVASAPVLQWVMTVPAPLSRSAPRAPMRRLTASSSRWMATASAIRASLAAATSACPSAARRILSTAHRKLTAVGRAAARSSHTPDTPAAKSAISEQSIPLAPSATPYAAATPIAGAPLTRISRMALATARWSHSSRWTSRPGSWVWSRSLRLPPTHSMAFMPAL